jgi:hypothetical protein
MKCPFNSLYWLSLKLKHIRARQASHLGESGGILISWLLCSLGILLRTLVFQEVQTLFAPHDFIRPAQSKGHHEDYVLVIGLVASFLGNLGLIAILSQKGRR